MNPAVLFLGFVILLGCGLYVIWPFYDNNLKKKRKNAAVLNGKEQHTATLKALRDLEFDFSLGKVTEGDYNALRPQLVSEAAQSLPSPKTVEKPSDSALEALILARKETLEKQYACPHCGKKIKASDNFCPACGGTVDSFCPKCGKRLEPDSIFCPGCGTRIVEPEPVTQ